MLYKAKARDVGGFIQMCATKRIITVMTGLHLDLLDESFLFPYTLVERKSAKSATVVIACCILPSRLLREEFEYDIDESKKPGVYCVIDGISTDNNLLCMGLHGGKAWTVHTDPAIGEAQVEVCDDTDVDCPHRRFSFIRKIVLFEMA